MSNCPCTSSPHSEHSVKEMEPLADIFKALGHPIRLMIVEMLIDHELCVCELQKDSGRDMSTISSHLNILKNTHIVTCEQRGKNVYYALGCPCLRNILECLKKSTTLQNR
ncbi:MAG: metalloregulator ArsR/SmtB family transcription factor [Akkermansia sp.]